ncbi:unnamed protein product [Blepharisma stoltei]|uniref:Uncharacterized protein n=1 Tax=Blepharisma stoltei TaxID=1481888 RepID=A0AAU9JBH0_9CILI|nr:unnamed protein product [Blepharisma stoltei]
MEGKHLSAKYFSQCCLLNMILNVIIFALQISALAVPQWFYYCYFDWGLVTLSTSKSDLKAIINSDDSYGNANNKLCEDFKPIIDAACKGFCGDLDRIRAAGIIMMIFMILSMIPAVMYFIVHLWLFRDKTIEHWSVYYGIWVQPLLYLIGITIYLAVADVYGIDDTWKDSENVSTGPGLSIGYSLIILQFISALISYNVTIRNKS